MSKIKALLFDLDGTVYRGTDAIPGAAKFIQGLKIPYLFVTNRGNRTPEAVAEQLSAMGLSCSADNVLTSAQAAAASLKAGTSAYCIGESGLTTVLEEQGIRVARDDGETPDAVVVSYDRGFSYDKITQALRYINAGARFIATNDDRVITVEDGLVPEAGPLVAAVAEATGKTPENMGKPYAPIMEIALKRLGVSAKNAAIVGDNLLTDILAGHNSGMKSVLILTGVSTRKDAAAAHPKPTWIAEDYDDLARILSSNVAKLAGI